MKLSTKTNLTFASVLAAAALVAACGGSTPAAESPADEAGAETASAAEESEAMPAKFDDMTAPQKMKHMKEVVAPEMAKVFQEANAEEFADFGCTNCHGPGAKNGDFEMPTKSLPALDQEEMDEHPEITKFMMEKVTPKMAELLGEEVYNHETQEGFGCYGCHTKKE